MKNSINGRSGGLKFVLAMAALSVSTSLSAYEQPNVVIMVADDIGYADMSFRGSDIETPSLDRLAAEGLELTRFYTTPICSPTRAALMTGRDPVRLGVAYGVLLPWDSGGVHTSEHFMPEAFQAAGYQTAMVGKWHLGHSQQSFHPNERGFDHFYGHLHTEVGFYPPFGILGGKDFQLNGESIDYPAEGEENYETYLLADHATDWLKKRDKDRPFFIYLPFLAPHEPLAAPAALVEKYAHLEDNRAPSRSRSDELTKLAELLRIKSNRPLYAAVVDAMDQAVGRVLNTLEEEGVADNTIILFMSDNGATRVQGRGGGDNAPFRGGKAEVYEGGIRVASLMRWPGHIEPGSQMEQMMSVMDVFPTLAAATGVEPQHEHALDGIDMLPALTRGERIKHKETLHFGSEIPKYGSFAFAGIEEEWKLVQYVDQEPLSTTVTHELFNLKDDPGEYNSLAAKHPQIVARLSASIQRWRALYPINGVRGRISSPPGWHPPRDWASYPRPLETLQSEPAESMAPTKATLHLLDYIYGERGRLIYGCDPTYVPLIGRVCMP